MLPPSSPRPRVNGAFVHLFTNECYLPGLLVLHQSHLDVQSRYPFVVMVTPSIPPRVRQILYATGMIVREVSLLLPRQKFLLEKGDSRFTDTWTKLRAFELFEYERVVLRDIDMLLLQNVDDLLEFDLPEDYIAATHVCACNPRRFPHYPHDWYPENCPYTPLSYPSCLSHATPITSSSPRPHNLLNGGVVVLTPSRQNARKVIRFLNTSPLIPTFKFPDQDFLSELFRGRWHPLPWVYNALKSLRCVHPSIWRDEDARCVHYIMAEKPWIAPRPMEADPIIAPPSPSGSSTASIASTDDISSIDSDTNSTPATSPATSQLDVRLRSEHFDEVKSSNTDCDDLDDCSSLGALGPSWMGESEEELLRWWWGAFDRLEIYAGQTSWWPLVEANVIGRPGARF